MRQKNIVRALAAALLAAGLTLAGPAAHALTDGPGRLAQGARGGGEDHPLVAQPAPRVLRVALRPSSLDDHGGRQLADALASRARCGPTVFERHFPGKAPGGKPRRIPATTRTSRGPPES